MRSSAAVTSYIFVGAEVSKVLLKNEISKVTGFPLSESRDRVAVGKLMLAHLLTISWFPKSKYGVTEFMNQKVLKSVGISIVIECEACFPTADVVNELPNLIEVEHS